MLKKIIENLPVKEAYYLWPQEAESKFYEGPQVKKVIFGHLNQTSFLHTLVTVGHMGAFCSVDFLPRSYLVFLHCGLFAAVLPISLDYWTNFSS